MTLKSSAAIPLRRHAPEIEIPKSLFIDHTSTTTRVVVDWPSIYPMGFDVPLGPNGETYLNVTQYRKVNVFVDTKSTKAQNFILYMGKRQPNTLAAAFQWAPDSNIHTFDVMGPEIALMLGAPPDRTTPAESVALWLYLSS